MAPPNRKVPRGDSNIGAYGLYQPFPDALQALRSVLDRRGHVALRHEVPRELFGGERNLVGVDLPLDEPKPVLAAFVIREGLPFAGRARVAHEVIFSVPPLVLWILLHLAVKPVIVDDQSPVRFEHPASLSKKTPAFKPM